MRPIVCFGFHRVLIWCSASSNMLKTFRKIIDPKLNALPYHSVDEKSARHAFYLLYRLDFDLRRCHVIITFLNILADNQLQFSLPRAASDNCKCQDAGGVVDADKTRLCCNLITKLGGGRSVIGEYPGSNNQVCHSWWQHLLPITYWYCEMYSARPLSERSRVTIGVNAADITT